MAWVVAAVTAGGCGIVSGLDSLVVDGGSDASIDTGADSAVDSPVDSPAEAVLLDASDGGPCSFTTGNPLCFGNTGCPNGDNCCVLDSGPNCSSTCQGVLMKCRDPDKCGDGGHCCLSNVAAGTKPNTCPIVLPTTSNSVNPTSAQCSTSDCTNTASTTICASKSDCPTNWFCREATFDLDPNAIFGICLPF